MIVTPTSEAHLTRPPPRLDQDTGALKTPRRGRHDQGRGMWLQRKRTP
jgi:hypothetical protein